MLAGQAWTVRGGLQHGSCHIQSQTSELPLAPGSEPHSDMVTACGRPRRSSPWPLPALVTSSGTLCPASEGEGWSTRTPAVISAAPGGRACPPSLVYTAG